MVGVIAHHYDIDIIEIERTHSGIRRNLLSKSQTWTLSFGDACGDWIVRQNRTNHGRSAKKRLGLVRVKKTAKVKKRVKKKHNRPCTWKAFQHVHLKGQKITAALVRQASIMYRATKNTPAFQVYEELAAIAKMADETGNVAFPKTTKIAGSPATATTSLESLQSFSEYDRLCPDLE